MATLHYTTPSDLTDILPNSLQAELTDDTVAGEPTVDTDKVEQILSFAESIAESYIVNRYSLPLTDAPPAFVHAILVIAKYNLALRRDFIDEAIERQHDNVEDWLLAIRNGILDMPGADDQLADDDVSVGFGIHDHQTIDRNIFNLDYSD